MSEKEEKEEYEEGDKENETETDPVEKETKDIEKIILKTDDDLARLRIKINERERFYTKCSLLEVEYSDEYAIERKGNRIIHQKYGMKWETCLLKKVFTEGMHKATFRRIGSTPVIFGVVNGMSSCPSSGMNIISPGFGVGIAVGDSLGKNVVNYLRNSVTGIIITGVAFGLIGEFISQVGLRKFDKNTSIKNKKGKEIAGFKRLENGDEISLEIDLTSNDVEKRTMHYFVNGEQAPITFTGLPPDVQFGVSLLEEESQAEFVCLEEMDKPSVLKSVKTEKIKWLSN